jgi:hypothetical protein
MMQRLKTGLFCFGFLLISLTLMGADCDPLTPLRSNKQNESARETGNLEEARELVRSFLDARIAGAGEDELEEYMTDEAEGDFQGRSGLTLTGSAEAPLLGYKISSESQVTTGEFGFSVAIQSSYTNRPAAENVREDLIVRSEGGEYRISSTRFLGRSSLRVEEGGLVWQDEKNKTSRLLQLKDLPAEFSPIGAEGEKYGTGREGFATLAIRPDNKEVAFGTWGTHGLVGVVPTDGKGAFTVLDLLFEAQARLLVYSPDGAFLAVEEAAPTGSTRIRVYEVQDKRLMDLGFSTAFPPDRYHLNISRWESDGKTLLIRVNRFSEEAEADKLGLWAVEVESGERQKVIQ